MASPIYMTDKRYINAANAYANQLRSQLNQQEKAMTDQLTSSKAGVGAEYDSSAAQNYINYMRQQNALPEQLRAQGLSGGASESATARMMNNYALNQANNTASRNAALGQLQNSFDTSLAQMRNDLNQTIADNAYQAQQQQIQFNESLRQKALEQFQATIERFTSAKSVDKAIASLDKNDPNYTAMKQLLQLRKSQINAASKSGSSGGGSRRRSYSGGGSSGGSNTSYVSTPSAAATVASDQSRGQARTANTNVQKQQSYKPTKTTKVSRNAKKQTTYSKYKYWG